MTKDSSDVSAFCSVILKSDFFFLNLLLLLFYGAKHCTKLLWSKCFGSSWDQGPVCCRFSWNKGTGGGLRVWLSAKVWFQDGGI
jgi:hypothetical protein